MLTFVTMLLSLFSEFDTNLLLLALAGFAAGFINVVAGGGSLITLPALMFLGGLESSVANGTNRLGILLQASSGAAGYKSKGINTFPFSIYCGIIALIGSLIGAQIAIDIKGDLFNKILAVVMVVVVVLIVFKPTVRASQLIERTKGKHLWITLIAFFFFGIYGGFINAGIGFVLLLFLTYFNQMNLLKANATKVTVVFIYTLAAAILFLLNDKISWSHGIVLALGNMVGAWISSRWAVKKGEGYIRVFLAVIVVAMAIKLWFFDL